VEVVEEVVETAKAGADEADARPEELLDDDTTDHRSQHHRRQCLLRASANGSLHEELACRGDAPTRSAFEARCRR